MVVCTEKSKVPLVMAVLLGTLHFLIVGIPFILAGGGGEGLLYLLFIDFPLFLLANIFAKRLLFSSVAFNFFLFPILGTILYAGFGFLIGRVVVVVRNKIGNHHDK